MRNRPVRWPLVVKVPLMAAGLVLVAAALVSAGVLVRLTQEQDARVSALGRAYLDTTAAALAPSLAHGDVWEAFDVLDRGRQAFGALRLRLAAVVLPNGRILAATDPRRLPVGSAPPAELASHGTGGLAMDRIGGLGWMARDVTDGGRSLGKVLVEMDLAEERAGQVRLLLVMVAVNAALALALAALGWWVTSRMLRPVRLLAAHLGGAADGPPTKLPVKAAGRSPEARTLFRRYNAMVESVEERQALTARLAEEERLATLGALAGSMAHEVNNPLGGMLTALDTIASHGSDPAVRTRSVSLLRRGLEDIRNVVRASLVLYKGPPTPGSALDRGAMDDLRLLAGPEAARRGVTLDWDNRVGEEPVDPTPIRQIVLNLLLNAIAATSPGGVVKLSAGRDRGRLVVAVSDGGPGLPEAMASILARPGPMPTGGGTGLGLWTAARAAQALGGTIRSTAAEAGTTLVLEIPMEERRADLAA
jgi:signal transduction histidine kinase